jgi:hypothetical protein
MKGTDIYGEEKVEIWSSGDQVSPTPFTNGTSTNLGSEAKTLKRVGV